MDILVQRGHKVTVLSGMPNYPHGRRFDGYKNYWVKRETPSKNLIIIRSTVWANDRRSTFKMLGNYLSFAFSGGKPCCNKKASGNAVSCKFNRTTIGEIKDINGNLAIESGPVNAQLYNKSPNFRL